MKTGEDLLTATTLWRESNLPDEALDAPESPYIVEDAAGDAPESLRSIWLSDVHLGTRGCRAEALADFLKHHHCENLFLVGDIVDGWRLKSKMYWPQAHSNVIRRVLTKAKRGCRVVYITGNHDEFLRRYSNLELGNIVLCDSAEHVTADRRRLLMIHGDQYDAVVQGHKWLAFLGDKGYELLLVINRWFNRFRERFGFGYWSLSAAVKHRVKKAVSFISDFEDAVAWDCRRRGFDGVVCGHIHHPEIRDFGGVTYYNCGDWVESCTALVEHHDGTIELRRWLAIGHDENHGIAAEATTA